MIPNDPFMLVSYINLKLRDEYSSFEALCDGLDVDGNEITKKLADAGFSYIKEQNQFR